MAQFKRIKGLTPKESIPGIELLQKIPKNRQETALRKREKELELEVEKQNKRLEGLIKTLNELINQVEKIYQ